MGAWISYRGVNDLGAATATHRSLGNMYWLQVHVLTASLLLFGSLPSCDAVGVAGPTFWTVRS